VSALVEFPRKGRKARRGRPLQTGVDRTRGKRIGAIRLAPGEPARQIDLGATLAAALDRHSGSSTGTENLRLRHQDLYRQVRHQKPRRLVVFLLDTSDSMGDGPEERMAATLGAAVSLAAAAYLNRDHVSLITFRDQGAKLLVPPTDSVSLLRKNLQRVPIGGATPLAAGLHQARQVIRQARMRDPEQRPLLVLISDGEATVPLLPKSDPIKDAFTEARRLRSDGVAALLIDTRTVGTKSGIMSSLAEIMGTVCHHLHTLQVGQVLRLIEQVGRNTIQDYERSR
jgi:magnesium chelatase subunit D